MTAVAGLRVLAFCDHMMPESIGGSERVSAEVYRRLADAGARITVVSAVAQPAPHVELANGYRLVRVPAVDLSRVVGGQLALSRRLGRVARQELEALRPHVLHANSLHFHGSIVAARLGRRSGLPLVTTAHLGSTDELAGPVRLAMAAWERTIGTWILDASTSVIAVSDDAARHVRRLGVPDERVTVVPNGVDHQRFAARRSPTAGDDRRPVVSFVGRLVANKGPSTLVDAFDRLVQRGLAFEGIIVGDGPLRPELERDVADRGLSEHVRFTGRLEDPAPVLAASDVFVRPSTTEGMSLALLEAMAAGCCVVASDIPANADLVNHGRNGLLFPVSNAAALADRLDEALRDPRGRRRLGLVAEQDVAAYTWESCAERTGAVLAQAAAAD